MKGPRGALMLSSEKLTKRQYLMMKVMIDTRCVWWLAMEAVATTALEHPEWDMSEEKTWTEWESDGK